MGITTDVIINYLRMFVTNMYVYYCFEKIANYSDNRIRNYSILGVSNIILVAIYIVMKSMFDSVVPFMLLYIVYTVIISKITKSTWGYSMIIILMAYALLAVCHTISIVVQFIPYKILFKLFNSENMYLSLVMISTIEYFIIYGLFKIKRFKNGLTFLNNKINNEISDIIMLNISTITIFVYCVLRAYSKDIRKNLFLMFVALGAIMFFTVKKMITMHYKHKLLTDTMEEYKKELADKQREIDDLKADKKNVSKITHEFYNRQKALELLVTSNMNIENIDKSNTNNNVLNIIESLTSEYSARFEDIKKLPKLDETEIVEIDNMFKYMQTECKNNNIEFKLKIMGNIHSLVNNIIPKNKLETLIGDHLRDAINAVNISATENKEILAILGMKNKKYELSIYDTGVDFEIGTLVKLGLEAVTTNEARGGTGTGFMTTFETLDETKASLVITEYPNNAERHYAKCVSIVFDGKKQYKICTHRANEIKKACQDKRIKVEQYKPAK